MRVCTLCRRLFVDDQSKCPDDASPVIELELDPMPQGLASRFPEAVPMARGATGALYRVDDTTRRVLKVLDTRLTDSAVARARFRRDFQKQIEVSHPNLPRLLEEGESAGHLWFLREFVSGESLALRLRRKRPTYAEALEVIAQLASALDELHRRGIVHGDIRPGHVIVRGNSQGQLVARLVDAGVPSPVLPQDKAHNGRSAYLAPESIKGQPSQGADLYALGCVSYELLAHAPAGETATPLAALATQPREIPRPEGEALPRALQQLVFDLLNEEPRRRPFSAQQVCRSLEPLLGNSASKFELRGTTLPPPAPEATIGLGTQELKVLSIPAASASADDDASDLSSEGSTGRAKRPTDSDALREDTAKYTLVRKAAQSEAPHSRESLRYSMPHLAPSSRARLVTHNGLGPDEASASKRGSDAQTSQSVQTLPLPYSETNAPLEAAQAADAHSSGRATEAQPKTSPRVPSRPERRKARGPFATRPLVERPSVVLWSAGALLIGMAALRTIQGPAPVRTRPASVLIPVCRQPLLPASAAAAASDSSRLIGGTPFGQARMQLLAAPVVAAESASPEPKAESPKPPAHVASSAPAAAQVAAPAVYVPQHDTHVEATTGEPAAEKAAQSQKVEPTTAAPNAPASAPDASRQAPQSNPRNDVAKSPPRPSATSSKSQDTGAARAQALKQQKSSKPTPAAAGRKDKPKSSAADSAGHSPSPEQAAVSNAPPVDDKARARDLFRARKFRAAAEAYSLATQKNPSDAGALAGLGASLLAAGDARGAVAAYQRAVQLQPRVSGFHAALGRAYLSAGDRARAHAAYGQALQLDPDNPAARAGYASTQ